MDIYDRITYQLKSQRKTRRSMCNETGISYATLSSLFQRRSELVKLSTIIKISNYLGVTIDYLIIGDRIKAGFNLAETAETAYGNNDTISRELLRIIQRLSIKGKALLLSEAYTLEEKESNE